MEAMDNMIDGHGVDVPVAVGVNCGEQLWEVLKERNMEGWETSDGGTSHGHGEAMRNSRHGKWSDIAVDWTRMKSGGA